VKAALLYGREDLRVEERPVPEIGAGEVLLRVKAAAVCGTDIRMYRHGARGVGRRKPLILGHEVSGVIELAGRGVSGYREGDRVTIAPNMGCGTCDQCVSGNTQLCAGYQAFGISIDGGFASYLRVPVAAVAQGNIAAIPDGVGFEEAALAEPFSCVYNGFLRCAITPGNRVLIIGAGPIGLMHAKLARMAGAAAVILNDLSEDRLAAGLKAEGSLIGIAGDESLKGRIDELTSGKGVDVCIIACPAAAAQQAALELTGINGRVLFFGGLPEGKSIVPLDTNLVHYKQLAISGTSRSSLIQFRQALRLLGGGRVRLKDLITGTFPVEGIGKAFDLVMRGVGLKNVIVFD
jgi:L-iditol 2-dehydrogenase